MELFGKKKPSLGIMEMPKAITPSPLAPLLNGHLIAFTDLKAKEPFANLHANHLLGYWMAPGNKIIRPENVTIEFALPAGFRSERFAKGYSHIVGMAEIESITASLMRHGYKKEYKKSVEMPVQWQSYDEDKKKEAEKMEKLHRFELETIHYLNRSKFEKQGLSPELADRTRKMLKVPFLMMAAGYKVRIGTYDDIKKLRAEDAAKGIAAPHRITVHLPLTEEDAIRVVDNLSREHMMECQKCSAFHKQTKGERLMDPSCQDRPKASYLGLSETRRLELRKKMREAELNAMKSTGVGSSANSPAKARV